MRRMKTLRKKLDMQTAEIKQKYHNFKKEHKRLKGSTDDLKSEGEKEYVESLQRSAEKAIRLIQQADRNLSVNTLIIDILKSKLGSVIFYIGNLELFGGASVKGKTKS